MPAVRPLPPAEIRSLLESHGYKLVASDDFNWAFAIGPLDAPVIVPHCVDLVPLDIAFHVAKAVGFNDYFDTLNRINDEPFAAPPSLQ